MSWTPNNTSTPIDPAAHPLGRLLKVALDTSISVEARLLYVILVLMAWTKGRCWPSQPYQAKSLGRSDRSIRDYHHELERAGLLIVERNPGVVNRYHPSILNPQEGTSETHCRRATEAGCRITPKLELQNVNNVSPQQDYVPPEAHPSLEPENVNAIEICHEKSRLGETTEEQRTNPSLETASLVHTPSPSESVRRKSFSQRSVPKDQTQPPLTQDQLFLVEEIEGVTGDTWSRGHFINLVRQADEHSIYAALSVTREKGTLETGVNLGAYFTSTLRGMIRLSSLGQKSSGNLEPPTQTYGPTVYASPTPRVYRLEESEPEPIDPDAMKKGWRIQYRTAGIHGMLSLVKRCLPDTIDTAKIWTEIRSLLPDSEESFRVDRFLDTIVTRMKHLERMAEA